MQFQRPPVSEIPDSVEDWNYSFARHEVDASHPYGKFRWRLGSNEWISNGQFGRWTMNGCDNENGHMFVRCRLLINDDGNAYYSRE